MIEIILVILILSVLLFAFRNIFQIKNKDVAYGQTCVEYVYGQVRSFADAATRSKGLASGTIITYPDQYQIFFATTTNSIQLKYSSGGVIYIQQSFNLTGDDTKKRYCTTNAYAMVLSGTTLDVHINK
jgi:hypothetical protein